MKPTPPVYDPEIVAGAMVKVALKPKSNTYAGSVSLLFKLGHALFPEIVSKITGTVMRTYFKNADPIDFTSGNVFNTVDYGMSIYGNSGLHIKPGNKVKLSAAAMVTGLIAGFILMKKIK